MDLFEIINNRAFPSPHALLIHPFKDMWEADTSKEKGNVIKVFTYIELVCSPKKSNPFFGYSEEDRPSRVKKEVFGDENYKTTDFMMQGVIKYKELLEIASPTYPMLTAGLIANDKLKNFLETFDLDERTQGGTAVIKPADITRALKEIPDVAKSIVVMREKVQTELVEEAKTRKDRDIGQYEE